MEKVDNVEQSELSHFSDKTVNHYNYFGKLTESNKTDYIHTFQSAIPFLSIYPTKCMRVSNKWHIHKG
jgi:hypothetical protein